MLRKMRQRCIISVVNRHPTLKAPEEQYLILRRDAAIGDLFYFFSTNITHLWCNCDISYLIGLQQFMH